MSATFDLIKRLVVANKSRVSQHAVRRMISHGIETEDLEIGLHQAEVLEDYPAYHTGPTVLVLHFDRNGAPLHSVWGIEKGTTEPAVLVTAYRPDQSLWSPDYRTRRP